MAARWTALTIVTGLCFVKPISRFKICMRCTTELFPHRQEIVGTEVVRPGLIGPPGAIGIHQLKTNLFPALSLRSGHKSDLLLA